MKQEEIKAGEFYAYFHAPNRDAERVLVIDANPPGGGIGVLVQRYGLHVPSKLRAPATCLETPWDDWVARETRLQVAAEARAWAATRWIEPNGEAAQALRKFAERVEEKAPANRETKTLRLTVEMLTRERDQLRDNLRDLKEPMRFKTTCPRCDGTKGFGLVRCPRCVGEGFVTLEGEPVANDAPLFPETRNKTRWHAGGKTETSPITAPESSGKTELRFEDGCADGGRGMHDALRLQMDPLQFVEDGVHPHRFSDPSDPWQMNGPPAERSGTMTLSSNPPVRSAISDALDDVAKFHDACGVLERKPGDPAALIRRVSRHRFLREGYQETEDGMIAGDVVEVADGLADLIYVALGSALVFYGRERFAKVWAEVQRTNMAKIVDGKVVKSSRTGKVIKPEGWTPPDIAGALK